MALQISHPTRYGVTAEYWKLQSSQIDWHNKSLAVVFSGYRDELSRQNGMQPSVVRDTAFVAGMFFPQTTSQFAFRRYDGANFGLGAGRGAVVSSFYEIT